MKNIKFEAFVEEGVIRLPDGVSIPNGTKVNVHVPAGHLQIASPRLANPQQASAFVKEVIKAHF